MILYWILLYYIYQYFLRNGYYKDQVQMISLRESHIHINNVKIIIINSYNIIKKNISFFFLFIIFCLFFKGIIYLYHEYHLYLEGNFAFPKNNLLTMKKYY